MLALALAGCRGGTGPTAPELDTAASLRPQALSADSSVTAEPKVEICHQGGDGSDQPIQIAASALPAHEAHGDWLVEAESCNGRDDDCDGEVDEGCPVLPPVAAFGFAPVGGSLNLDFRDESLHLPQEWLWDFGDGEVSTEQNPRHEFPNAGEFLVMLTVSNPAGSSSTAEFVPVGAGIPDLKADFDFDVGSDGLMVSFTDTSRGAPTSWHWDFGDGATSGEQDPTHTYPSSDHYRVRLTASNAAGSDSKSKLVRVDSGEERPVAAFSFEKLGGLTVKFTDESLNEPRVWMWDFGDGCGGEKSNEQNPTHEFCRPGDYPVKLEVRNKAGSDSTTRLVAVGVDPPPP